MGNLYWSKGGSLQQLCSSSYGIMNENELTETDYTIAEAGLQPLVYEEEVNRSAQKYLYEKLTETDSLIQDSVMENFVMESETMVLPKNRTKKRDNYTFFAQAGGIIVRGTSLFSTNLLRQRERKRRTFQKCASFQMG